MGKKIIFFDIDGTLYAFNSDGITDRVKNAISNTRKKGVLCFIASGRPYGYIAENVREVGFDGYVLANGANIKYDDKDIEVRHLDRQRVIECITDLKRKHIEYILLTPGLCYIDKENHCLLDFYSRCNIDFKNFCYDFNEEDIIDRVVKLEVWCKNQDEVDYVSSHLHGFSYELHPDHHSMEVYAGEVSKATGIQDVLELLDIDINDSYCFGDGPNDIEMFEAVAHPNAMGNAIDVIKAKAERICLSVEEDGVALALEEMFK